MKVLVTGAAGFIGAAVALRLLERGDAVVGVDNLDPYYDVDLKRARLARITVFDRFRDVRADIADQAAVREVFEREQPEAVVHLAARAGVRHSLERPQACVDANVAGFLHVLEACREHPPRHLVYASSSSVYGANRALPFSVRHTADHPASLYAATKRSNELMAHCYSHLFGLPATGLRFFTVYGPWGRPDMALFRFTRNILAGRPIEVYNHGRHRRDFTYIDDVVEGVVRVVDRPATPDPEWRGESPDPGISAAPYRVYNLGNRRAEPLERCIEVLEAALGRKAERRLLPLQPGDVPDTLADVDDLIADVGYRPDTPIEVGVRRFVDWYRAFYRVK